MQANQIAHRLRELGVKPNTLAAIVMEKGWEQIVAVFGVIKAGGGTALLVMDRVEGSSLGRLPASPWSPR